ncbi:MAG: hypothetical protein GY869_29105, partial [Planctomycetes bacterium]|nr:hypothetical protein [Planctomycetota bacterium]
FIGYFAKEYYPKVPANSTDQAKKTAQAKITKRLNDEGEPSVFRHMVGISAQPWQAMEFIRGIKLKGVISNEWNHGGFVAFHQDPDPETGEPPCKLLIDGRAQAAYRLDHFDWWRYIRFAMGNSNPNPNPNSTQPYWSSEQAAEFLQEHQVNAVLIDTTKGAVAQVAYAKLKETPTWSIIGYPLPTKDLRFPFFLRLDDINNREALMEISRFYSNQAPSPETIKK